MSGVIADLMVNLIANDVQLVTATKAAGEAMERLGGQAMKTQVTVKGLFTEAGFEAQSMAVKIEESAQASARSLTVMSRGMSAELASVRSLAAQRDEVLRESWQAELAGWHKDVAAVQALAKQKATAVIAAEREAAIAARDGQREQAAASQAKIRTLQEEMAASRSLAAQRMRDTQATQDAVVRAWAEERAAYRQLQAEKLAIQQAGFAAIREQMAADVSLARQRSEALIAEERRVAAARIVAEREAAAAAKVSAAQRAASAQVVNNANVQSTSILKSLFGMFGSIGQAGINFGKTFQGVATSVLGAGSAAVGAAGPIGMAVGAAAGMIKTTFNAAFAVVGMYLDALKRVGEGLLAIGTIAVIAASKFDQLMLRTVTMAQAPIQELGRMKQAVLDMSTEVGHMPNNMAKALYHVESLGFRGAEALEILKRASQEAALSGSNLEDTTSALGAIMRVGLKDVHDAADAASYLNTITGIGNMTMQDMTSAIGTGILPVLRAAGLGMRDMGAALAVATDNAEPANQAMTRLRQVLSMISTMAIQPKKVDLLASIGLGPNDLQEAMKKGTDATDGFQKMLHTLHDHLVATFGSQAIDQLRSYNDILNSDGVEAADAFAAANSKAVTVINGLFGGARGSGAIDMYLTQLGLFDQKASQLGTTQERNARFAESWKEQTKQLSQEWKNFKATIEAFTIKIGEGLIPFVKDIFHAFGEFGKSVKFIFSDSQIGDQFIEKIKLLASQFIPWLKKELDDLGTWIKHNKDNFERLGRFITTDVLPAMNVLVKEGIHQIIEAIKWTIIAITGLTDAWQEHHTAIRFILKFMLYAFVAFFTVILDAAIISFGWIPVIGEKLQHAKSEFAKFADEVNKAINTITRVVPVEIYGFISGPAGQLIGTGDNSFNTRRGDGGLVRGRASGGPVDAGVPYVIGEDGPELVVFNQSGYVVPNNRMGSALGTGQRSGSPRPAGDSGGGGGGGVMLVEARVYLDGEELQNANIRLAQRYKRRNTGTGMN